MGLVDESTVLAERLDYVAMVDAVDAVGEQFISQLRELQPADGERKVPGLTWTVSEVAVHMLNIVNRGLGDRRRADSLEELAELNQQCVDETDIRAPSDIADRLAADKAVLLAILRSQTAEAVAQRTFPLHVGVVTNVPTALSYMLFDFLSHGLDIARGAERDWHIDAAHAALDLHACLPILGPWADDRVVAGPAQRLAIGFPADGDAIVIELGDGRYRAQNYRRDEVDDVAEVDPVRTILAIAGREPATEPPVTRLASWFNPI